MCWNRNLPGPRSKMLWAPEEAQLLANLVADWMYSETGAPSCRAEAVLINHFNRICDKDFAALEVGDYEDTDVSIG